MNFNLREIDELDDLAISSQKDKIFPKSSPKSAILGINFKNTLDLSENISSPEIQSEKSETELDQSTSLEITLDQSESSESEIGQNSTNPDENFAQIETSVIDPQITATANSKITSDDSEVFKIASDESNTLKKEFERLEADFMTQRNSEIETLLESDSAILADPSAQSDQKPIKSDQKMDRNPTNIYFNETYHESETVIVDDLNDSNNFSQIEPEVPVKQAPAEIEPVVETHNDFETAEVPEPNVSFYFVSKHFFSYLSHGCDELKIQFKISVTVYNFLYIDNFSTFRFLSNM